jgi:hypothetical protein
MTLDVIRAQYCSGGFKGSFDDPSTGRLFPIDLTAFKDADPAQLIFHASITYTVKTPLSASQAGLYIEYQKALGHRFDEVEAYKRLTASH